MHPSRFGPGRQLPGPPMRPGGPPPPHMGRPPPPSLLPPPHHHPGMPRPPPPPGLPPPGLGGPPPPPPDGATPGGGGNSSRKRSRWDQPGGGGTPATAGAAAADVAAPGSASWPRPAFGPGRSPGGARQEEPPSKRLAGEHSWPPFAAAAAAAEPACLAGAPCVHLRPGACASACLATCLLACCCCFCLALLGFRAPPAAQPASPVFAPADGRANGTGPYPAAGLESAASWDVESQFAVGAAGTYLGATAAGAGAGNLSPDVAAARTYSPVASPGNGANQAGGEQGISRPMSAAYSHGSGGAAAAAGGGAPAGPAPSNGGGPHLSPMSDDEPPPSEPPPLQPPQQQQQAAAGQRDAPESWNGPDASFAAYVADMVRHRVGKYAQPEHPMYLAQEEAKEVGLPLLVPHRAAACDLTLPAACLMPALPPPLCFCFRFADSEGLLRPLSPAYELCSREQRPMAQPPPHLTQPHRTPPNPTHSCSCIQRSAGKSWLRSSRRTMSGRRRASSSPSSAASLRCGPCQGRTTCARPCGVQATAPALNAHASALKASLPGMAAAPLLVRPLCSCPPQPLTAPPPLPLCAVCRPRFGSLSGTASGGTTSAAGPSESRCPA